MISKNLTLKFYLWFLLALFLTVAGTVGVVSLVSLSSFEESAEEWIQAELGVGRDIIQNLLASGMDYGEVERLLAPLAGKGDISVMVTATGQHRPLVKIQVGESDPSESLPTPEEERKILERGFAMTRNTRRISVGLPLELPGGEPGILYISHFWGRGHGHGHGPPLRFIAGVASVLGVGWVMCWLLAGHLTRPLRKMTSTAEKLGQGDLSARIKLKRRDEIGRLAGSFNTMAENLQRLVLSHKQLLADISHELRSPLARLKVALELARPDAPGKNGEYLDTVEREADAIDGMIEELLLYSRLDSAPYQMLLEPLSLAEAARQAAANHSGEAAVRDVRIVVEAAETLPEVQADRHLLMRALENVVRNGVNYTSESSELIIAASRSGGRLHLSVTDQGGGVPADSLERIFDPFYRTDAARGRSTGGVGLGLAIAKRCMETQHGGIGAQPGPGGRGLRITLWLPDPTG